MIKRIECLYRKEQDTYLKEDFKKRKVLSDEELKELIRREREKKDERGN